MNWATLITEYRSFTGATSANLSDTLALIDLNKSYHYIEDCITEIVGEFLLQWSNYRRSQQLHDKRVHYIFCNSMKPWWNKQAPQGFYWLWWRNIYKKPQKSICNHLIKTFLGIQNINQQAIQSIQFRIIL